MKIDAIPKLILRKEGDRYVDIRRGLRFFYDEVNGYGVSTLNNQALYKKSPTLIHARAYRLSYYIFVEAKYICVIDEKATEE